MNDQVEIDASMVHFIVKLNFRILNFFNFNVIVDYLLTLLYKK